MYVFLFWRNFRWSLYVADLHFFRPQSCLSRVLIPVSAHLAPSHSTSLNIAWIILCHYRPPNFSHVMFYFHFSFVLYVFFLSTYTFSLPSTSLSNTMNKTSQFIFIFQVIPRLKLLFSIFSCFLYFCTCEFSVCLQVTLINVSKSELPDLIWFLAWYQYFPFNFNSFLPTCPPY